MCSSLVTESSSFFFVKLRLDNDSSNDFYLMTIISSPLSDKATNSEGANFFLLIDAFTQAVTMMIKISSDKMFPVVVT